MILDDTTVSLEAVMESAAATTNPDFTVDWVSRTSTATDPDCGAGALNGTTAVELVAAPGASESREIKRLTIYNRDTAEVVVRIRVKRSATSYVVARAVVPVGGSADWSARGGFSRSNYGAEIRSIRGRTVRDLLSYSHVSGGGGIESNYVAGQVQGTGHGTGAAIALYVIARPFVAPMRASPTVDRIGVYVTTGVAATNVRLGIYDSRASYGTRGRSTANLVPGRLLYDSGNLSTATSSTAATASPNLVLVPGRLYWAVAFYDGAPTMRSASAAAMSPFFGQPNSIAGTSAILNFIGTASGGDAMAAFGALSTNFPTVVAQSSGSVIFVRYSA